MQLDRDRKNAFIVLLVAIERLRKKAQRALESSGHVCLEIYDVLLCLEEAREGKLTMSTLSDRVLLTPSGITRLVDRMVKQGLVVREECPTNRRYLFAVITDKGLKARSDAWPVLESVLAEELESKLSIEDAKHLVHAMLPFVEEADLIGFERCQEGA